jgi:hypothetical protein
MRRKNSRRNQKLYKMKGCSKSKSLKKYLGGSPSNISLAYPSSNVPTSPNPSLAYTGKNPYKGIGGSTCSSNKYLSDLAYPQNINGANPTYPSTGPPSGGFNFLNPQNSQHGGAQKGGNCGCGLSQMGGGKKGGTCPTCLMGFMAGGSHRVGCKCSACKRKMHGGSGNNGIPYPDGLVGSPWTPSVGGWPGVSGVDGGSNYLAYNTYPTDVQTSMISTGANPPFSIGGGKKSRKRRSCQKGGTLSNFLAQDLINLGRQFQFGLGSAYNGLAGYAAPASPLPWQGQFPGQPSVAAIKANVI